MSSAVLASLGAAAWDALWLPVLAWTALAVVADAALRLGRASARLGLGVRGALLALLPGLLVAPPVLARWVPSLVPAAPASRPLAVAPVEVTVPVDLPSLSAPAPALWDVSLGVATLAAALTSVFAVGVLIGGLVWLGRYRRGLGAASASVQGEARALADQLGVRRRLDVALAEPASAPFTVGWRRPLVAVPADLGGEPLRLALAHELAHVQEGHYGWSLAERVVRAVFVWHPLAHALGRALALDRERAADAVVVRLWPDRARQYGRLLHAVASRPSPALALGASSSTLLHRLDAMTRLRPDRRRLARLSAAAVLALPLLLAASALPDPAAASAQPPVAQAAPSDSDSLMAHVRQRSIRTTDGVVQMEVRLRPDTPRSVAVAIADYLADGDEAGTLTVFASDGEPITRSTLRADAVPPPPPAPPAPPAPPQAPIAPPAAPAPPPPALAPPTPPAPPAAPARPPNDDDLSDAQIARAASMLEEQLVAVSHDLDELLHVSPRTPEIEINLIRLHARRDLILERYRNAVSYQEERRLDRLYEEARTGQ